WRRYFARDESLYQSPVRTLSSSFVANDQRPTTNQPPPPKNEGRHPGSIFRIPANVLRQLGVRVLVARVPVRSRGWSARTVRRSKPRQPRIERRDFKRHLVTRGSDCDRSRFHHLRFVVPRVDLDAAAQGQRRDLIQFVHVQRRALRGQSRQPVHSASFSQRVAQVRGQQRIEL